MAGCASAGRAPAPEFVRPQWPEPPQAARIVYERWFSSDRHLGRERSFGEQMAEILAGKKQSGLFLEQPMDLVVSEDGQRLFVSDFTRGKVYLFDFSTLRVTAIPQGELLANPLGVALDGEGNLFVAEQSSRSIAIFDRELRFVRRITDDSLVRPADLAIDRERGLLYVADPARQEDEDHSVKVFDLEGRLLRRLGAGRGLCDACLLFPTYVAVDATGRVLVSSTLKGRVDIFDAEGGHVGHIGERGNQFGMFDRPKGVALDSFGNVYVVDSGWSNVQIFNPKGQVLLFFGGRGEYPGLLKNPNGIAIDGNNTIYVADYLNSRVTVYKLVNTKAEDSYLEPGADTSPSTSPAVSVATPLRHRASGVVRSDGNPTEKEAGR